MKTIKSIRLKYIIDLVNDIKDSNIKKIKKKELINIINNNHLLVDLNSKVKDIRTELLFYIDFIKYLKNKINLDNPFRDLVKEKGIVKMIINYTNIETLILDNFYKEVKEYNEKNFKIQKMNIHLDLFKVIYL